MTVMLVDISLMSSPILSNMALFLACSEKDIAYIFHIVYLKAFTVVYSSYVDSCPFSFNYLSFSYSSFLFYYSSFLVLSNYIFDTYICFLLFYSYPLAFSSSCLVTYNSCFVDYCYCFAPYIYNYIVLLSVVICWSMFYCSTSSLLYLSYAILSIF